MKSLLPIILILSALGLFFFYTNKNYVVVKGLQKQVSDYEQALVRSKEILQKRSVLQEQYKRFSTKDLENIKKILPDTVDNVQLILDINGIAKEHGMALRGIEMEGESLSKDKPLGPDKNPIGNLEVTFQVTSTYQEFVEFLKDLEKSLRIVDVTNISFKAAENNRYNFEVTIKTYWLK